MRGGFSSSTSIRLCKGQSSGYYRYRYGYCSAPSLTLRPCVVFQDMRGSARRLALALLLCCVSLAACLPLPLPAADPSPRGRLLRVPKVQYCPRKQTLHARF